MKWFKHFSDNHRGKSVQYLLDELGYFGPFFKDTILEMCAEKMDRQTDRDLTADDCEFVFHRRVVESATRAKRSTVGRALDAGQSANFWRYSFDEEYIKISAPILLDLLEYDQKKSRQRRAEIAPGKRLEKSREEKNKNREEKNEVTNVTSSAVAEVSSSAAVVRLPKPSEIFHPKNENEMISGLSPKTLARWATLYSDPDFLRRESIKAFGYYENNKLKTPKTVRGWTQALSTWFERGWPRHVAQIQSVANAGLSETQFNDMLAGGDT